MNVDSTFFKEELKVKLVSQAVCCVVYNSRGRNINVILGISCDFGVIHYSVAQETLDYVQYQRFINQLIVTASPMYNDPVYIIHDGARPHLNTLVSDGHQNIFSICRLPPYSPFLNPVEHAHSCFKAAIQRQLTQPATQEELRDTQNKRLDLELNLGQWKSRINSLR